MEADGLFIYGTLREGGANHAWLQRTHPTGSCRAWLPGRLFLLPNATFPAMVEDAEPLSPPPGRGWVTGEFIGYEDEEDLTSALADLDQLEEVEQGMFFRKILPVILDSGHRYGAWVYLFPKDRLSRLEKEATELPGGDWSHYLG